MARPANGETEELVTKMLSRAKEIRPEIMVAKGNRMSLVGMRWTAYKTQLDLPPCLIQKIGLASFV